ncbi:chorismate synthase [Leadbettera azotonutricia]|uniref:Chorismate synthase n=1 Tax=Leadbettera azotonutricia (strain ATCC BAA-888 / DSM 13862 / ZAS-9) TaxID=545695 RepID=F5YAG5_LEAAZ|nr:chorismate synthase [Leadbettera azotonutricia]AEF82537.1 chorismate synthase [Leadbettera azotonutricia ZAS-9]
MGGSSFGVLFKAATFGESHGPASGCVVDGCPAGLALDIEDIRHDLARRRPGGGGPATSRSEADEPEILSGVFEGKTLGSPIAILVRNKNQRPSDYDNLKDLYRPGHADWPWEAKYGFRDHRGGGRSSARETLGRVAAGAIARVFLSSLNIEIIAWTSSAAGIDGPGPGDPSFNWDEIENNPLRMGGKAAAAQAMEKIEALRQAGDSSGCAVSCVARNLPPGLGEPVFDKLDARIAAAMLSLGAAKAVEFGAGSSAAKSQGSVLNDRPMPAPGLFPDLPGGVPSVSWKTNNAGGVLGGLSTGMDLCFTVSFKPISSILQKQETVNRQGKAAELLIQGRHDICVGPRAVPVVEAMTALVLADLILLQRCALV